MSPHRYLQKKTREICSKQNIIWIYTCKSLKFTSKRCDISLGATNREMKSYLFKSKFKVLLYLTKNCSRRCTSQIYHLIRPLYCLSQSKVKLYCLHKRDQAPAASKVDCANTRTSLASLFRSHKSMVSFIVIGQWWG